MKTAILTIGTEILFGQVVNTNAAYLSKELQNLGYDVMYHYTVGDNPARLKELLGIAYRDCDLILTTGGLGPTQDDLTKEVICEYFGDEMVEFPEVRKWLTELFANSHYKWSENNLSQARFPSKAKILANPTGTAPGFMLEKNGKIIFSMPGPPREMTKMFTDHIKPYLKEHTDGHLFYRILRFYGIGESMLETKLLPLIDDQTDPTIATYAKEGEVSLRITSKRAIEEEAVKAVDEMIEKVKAIVGEYLYSCEDEELVDVLAKTLLEKRISISACESCTAGLFTTTLAGHPGISEVLDSGLVTYSEEAKMRELGVKKETLEKYTAISEQTAREMADGLYEKTGSDVCVSITGVAGPDDINEEQKAGLAYIGLRYKGETKVIRTQTRNISRKHNMGYMVLRMLSEVYHAVK